MKKPLIYLFIFFFGIPCMLAQMPHQNPIIKDTNKGVQQNSNKLYFLATESFPLDKRGRLYLKNEFVDGFVVDYENESIPTTVRYRVADDEMQIKHLNKVKALYPSKIKRIVFKTTRGDQVFVPAEYLEKKIKVFGYFELLSEGQFQLLKMYTIKRGKLKTCYYTQKEGELAENLKMNKSKVLNVFKDRKSEAAKYAAKENLNLKNIEDLKKVFEYMNKK